MNSFYEKPKWLQWIVALILLILSMVCMGSIFKLIDISGFFFLGFLIFAPFLQFCFAPFFTLIGTYHYLSPMMLVFSPNDKKYDLHMGTSFDYLYVMKNVPSGKATEMKLLYYFCEGFLEIIKRIEEGELPKEVSITGTSYFMSEKSAERLGFKIGKTNWFLTFNLYLNFLDLFWMYSRSKGKMAIPKLSEAKSIETTGEGLMERKEYIRKLRDRLA